MTDLKSLFPSNWHCHLTANYCHLSNDVTKEEIRLWRSYAAEINTRLINFIYNCEEKKIYFIGQKYYGALLVYCIYDFSGKELFACIANQAEFQSDGKSLFYTTFKHKMRIWFDYTHKDIFRDNQGYYNCYLYDFYTAKIVRALLECGDYGDEIISTKNHEFNHMSYMELAVRNEDIKSVKALLLKGVDPRRDCSFTKKKDLSLYNQVCMLNSYRIACVRRKNEIVNEMREWMRDKKAYEHKNSTLIPFVIGIASLDWPVLVCTIIAEYLVWVNDDFIAQFSEIKSWKIAALVKQKYRKINI